MEFNKTEMTTFMYEMENQTSMVTFMTEMTTEYTDVYYGVTGLGIAIGILLLVMAAVGIVGNIFVILAVMLTRRLQTATNAFVVNLSVADLMACLTLPAQASTFLGNELAVEMCVTSSIVTVASLGCSIFTITLIAVNRYMLITKMKHVYQKSYTPPTIAAMIAAAWILAPVLMILVSSKKVCGVYLVKHEADYLSWIVPILLFVSPVIVLVCYILILVHVRRHVVQSMVAQSGTRRLDIAITKNLLAVVCAFYICILPYPIVVTIAKSSEDGMRYSAAILFCTIFLNINSIVNPIIYAWRHPIIKPVFGQMIRCRWSRIAEPSSLLKFLLTRSSTSYDLDSSRGSRSSTGIKTDSEYV